MVFDPDGRAASKKHVCERAAHFVRMATTWRFQSTDPIALSEKMTKKEVQAKAAQSSRSAVDTGTLKRLQQYKNDSGDSLVEFRANLMADRSLKKLSCIHFLKWNGDLRTDPDDILWAICSYPTQFNLMKSVMGIVMGTALLAAALGFTMLSTISRERPQDPVSPPPPSPMIPVIHAPGQIPLDQVDAAIGKLNRLFPGFQFQSSSSIHENDPMAVHLIRIKHNRAGETLNQDISKLRDSIQSCGANGKCVFLYTNFPQGRQTLRRATYLTSRFLLSAS